jgi:HYR domain-containing protein
MVLDGFNNCAPRPVVDFESLTPGFHVDQDTGEGMDPHRVAVGPDGVYATQPQTNRVIRLNPGTGISTVASVQFLAGAGIGAYPPQLGNVHYTTVIIRIDSPVEVVVSDAHGRRLGAIAGQSINEFGEWGYDSGPQSHPRFYVINHPQPGAYSVRSVGTGSGPFTVHVYSVDTIKGASQHLSSTGIASPGGLRKHDFTLAASGAIAFNNANPIADAGADQTLAAGAAGTAVVALEGSASDPDGDPVSYTWAGADAFARGATAQLSLPVGTHVLTLTVDDGRGGTGKDTVRITVTGTAADTTPPVIAAHPNVTVPATGANGALVLYTAPAATDAVDANPVVTCLPAAGSVFAVGTTPVTCTATDAAGNTAGSSFDVIVQVGSPRIAATLVGKGRDASGSYFVDIQLKNTGTGHARNLRLTQVPVRTLAGTGVVSYNAALSPALPIAVGGLDVDAATVIRFYLNVPLTVSRFSITETGSLQNVLGATVAFSAAQSIVP